MQYTILILLFIVIMYVAIKIRLDKVEGDIKVIHNTLNRLVDHFELPESPINNQLRALIQQDEEIKAIKKAREEFGLSLIEGKQYIDRLKLTINEQKG